MDDDTIAFDNNIDLTDAVDMYICASNVRTDKDIKHGFLKNILIMDELLLILGYNDVCVLRCVSKHFHRYTQRFFDIHTDM